MEYKLIRSKRKSLSLSVDDELDVVVRAPYFVTKGEIDAFVAKNTEWIALALDRKKKQLDKYNISEEERNRLKALANEVLPHKVKYYSSLMKLYPTDVKITSAKKRFGSCSSKNSLCFSYYLMMYDDKAVDYVVVHELAHIKHHNHGKEFYRLIEKYLPDYKEREKMLKEKP
ncbi:MAG: M48 family metallopeptidase [Eubacterium sp.]